MLAEIKALEAAGDIENPRYMELLVPHYYEQHLLRMPSEGWPDPVRRGFAHINQQIYVPMQGPSELGMSAEAKLARWDRVADLHRIDGADAGHRRQVRHHGPGAHGDDGGPAARGRYLYCPNGSHMAMYDDQQTYFAGLTAFLNGLPTRQG